MEKQLAHGAQQFSSLLAHLFPEAPLPLGELLHTDSGLALALGQERSREKQILQGSPEQTQSTQQENVCLQEGL